METNLVVVDTLYTKNGFLACLSQSLSIHYTSPSAALTLTPPPPPNPFQCSRIAAVTDLTKQYTTFSGG